MREFFGSDVLRVGESQSITSILSSYAKEVELLDRETYTQAEFEAAVQYFGNYPSIKMLEDLLSFYKSKKEKILVDDIPSYMAENGLKSTVLENGKAVSIDTFYSAKILDKEAFVEYLVENKADGIIKSELTFDRGEDITGLKTILAQYGYSYSLNEEIHPMSLKKLVRETMESGEELPSKDVLSVQVFSKAKIK